MKEKILTELRKAGDGYVSGTALCSLLGISRQAVWKNIAALKENGYQVESVASKGYRLLSEPDKMYGPDILSRIDKDCLCKQVESFECIDSTNTKVKQLAEAFAKEGLLVVAEEQTGGKGRRGRVWKSEPGIGIWMSLLLRPTLPTEQISGLTLLAALAIAGAVEKLCKLPCQIKWPNDVVVAKKKICGILTEMSTEENYIHYVVVGMGINANTLSFPDEIKETATSLFLQTGKKVDRAELTAMITQRLCAYYERFEKEGDLTSFIDEYNEKLANKEREVRIYHGMVEKCSKEDIETGVAKGIDKTGALLVEVDGQTKRVVSGEVSVRGLYGYV